MLPCVVTPPGIVGLPGVRGGGGGVVSTRTAAHLAQPRAVGHHNRGGDVLAAKRAELLAPLLQDIEIPSSSTLDYARVLARLRAPCSAHTVAGRSSSVVCRTTQSQSASAPRPPSAAPRSTGTLRPRRTAPAAGTAGISSTATLCRSRPLMGSENEWAPPGDGHNRMRNVS